MSANPSALMTLHFFSRSVCGVTNSLADMYGLRCDDDAVEVAMAVT